MWLSAVFNWAFKSLLGIAVVFWERRLVGLLRSWIFSLNQNLGFPRSVLCGGAAQFSNFLSNHK